MGRGRVSQAFWLQNYMEASDQLQALSTLALSPLAGILMVWGASLKSLECSWTWQQQNPGYFLYEMSSFGFFVTNYNEVLYNYLPTSFCNLFKYPNARSLQCVGWTPHTKSRSWYLIILVQEFFVHVKTDMSSCTGECGKQIWVVVLENVVNRFE